MKILQMIVKNYRGIEAMLLNLNGDNCRIAGKTDQSKTTAISLLWEIIKIVGHPIKLGAKKATIKLVLGNDEPEIIAERTFTPSSSTISITHVDNTEKKIPLKEFKNWYAKLGINPHKIMDMGAQDQMNILLSAVTFPEGFNLQTTDEEILKLSGDISDLVKVIDITEKEMGKEPEQAEKVEIKDLFDERDRLREHNTLCADTLANRDIATQKGQEILKEIDILRKKLQESYVYVNDCKGWLEDNTHIPETEIQEKIDNASATNIKATAHTTWQDQKDSLSERVKKKNSTSRTVKNLKNSRLENLQKATWPLPGLSVEDNVIIYENIPLSQHGKSKQMLVCCILAAEQIKDKKLKVVRMDGIESMDPHDYETVEQLYNNYKIQVVSTRVIWGDEETEEGELLIRDGEIIQ